MNRDDLDVRVSAYCNLRRHCKALEGAVETLRVPGATASAGASKGFDGVWIPVPATLVLQYFVDELDRASKQLKALDSAIAPFIDLTENL